ncbi:acyltransferase family protein [Microlunatus sp. Gsoil 973]|nr:acyltransferase family protein [Microlunatus sp. Gsoil 973]
MRGRLGYLDNLRAALTVLVVAHHAAITYSNLPLWYYTEPRDNASATGFVIFLAVNQMYFMGFFFLISGLFVPGSVDRKGPWRFFRDRLIRLGIPLVGFWLLIRPLLAIGSWPEYRKAGLSPLAFFLAGSDPGPMWFVEVLLVLGLVYAIYRSVRGRSLDQQRSAVVPDARVGNRMIMLLIGVLTVVTYSWRLVVPSGTYWPIVGLPTPYYLPQYVFLFVVGLLAQRRGWFSALTVRQGWAGLVMALVAGVPALGFSTVHGPAYLASVFCEQVFAVGVIMALLVLFRTRINRTGAVSRFASGQAFAVYVIHPLVLVAVARLIAPLAAPGVVKFAVLVVIAVPVCWAAAYLLRRIPGVRRVL